MEINTDLRPDLKKDELCIWKYIVNGAGQTEGRLNKCDNECNGYNTNCEYYISHDMIKRRDLR